MKYMLLHYVNPSVKLTEDQRAQVQRQMASWLDEAIEVASKHTTAWVGSIEVRPFGPW